MSGRAYPAWSLRRERAQAIAIDREPPEPVTKEWALAGATGDGVSVCILDSGIEAGHPLVGEVASAVAVSLDGEEIRVDEDREGDACGHGTACAGIVRAVAPGATLHSVRVLGAGSTGSGEVLLAGLRYAVEQGFDVVNMSLSTTRRRFVEVLHELADTAYFRRTVLVASAHNMPVESFPWRFSSVLSVGSHDLPDPLAWYANPEPPVEFFARGVDVDVAWLGGGSLRCTGNSFATPHLAAICALVLSKHRELAPFQLKSVLYQTAANVGGGQ